MFCEASVSISISGQIEWKIFSPPPTTLIRLLQCKTSCGATFINTKLLRIYYFTHSLPFRYSHNPNSFCAFAWEGIVLLLKITETISCRTTLFCCLFRFFWEVKTHYNPPPPPPPFMHYTPFSGLKLNPKKSPQCQ